MTFIGMISDHKSFDKVKEELIDLQGTVLLFMLMKPVFDVVV